MPQGKIPYKEADRHPSSCFKGKGEIAEELCLSYASVVHHFNAIFRLMGVHSRVQALLKATRREIIPGEQ
ncbi:MAG: response regulator transcription factor [Vulcanimicrobiota bacterium]